MKILLVHMRYAPDPTGTGPLVTQLAEGLVDRGDDVTVITSVPHYGRESVPPEYRGGVFQEAREHGVRVLRTMAFPLWTGTVFGRAVDYSLYTILAILRGMLLERADVMLVVAPPITVGLVGRLLRNLRRMPMVYNAQDIWPDGLVRMGKLRSRPIIAAFHRLERWVYHAAVNIVVVSDEMKDNLVGKGVSPAKVAVISNWVDLDAIGPLERDNRFRARHGIGDDFLVLFAGNLGFAAGLETVLQAAAKLRGHRDIRFVIVGEGSAKAELKRIQEQQSLDNVLFLETQPTVMLNEMMSAADVSLVTLRRGMGALSVPSKTYTIMASGRPVLASVPEDSAIRRVVLTAGCGRVEPPEDPQALADAIVEMKASPQALDRMGQQGRKYAEAHFGRDRALDRYRKVLASAAGVTE